MSHNLFNFVVKGEYTDYFQSWAIANKGARNISVQISAQMKVFIFIEETSNSFLKKKNLFLKKKKNNNRN